MYVSYTFKVNNITNNKPPDGLILLLNQKNKHIEDWRLCPIAGKVLNWQHPIAKGIKANHTANLTSFDLIRGDTIYATLELKKNITLLNSENDIGYFTSTDNSIERTVVYIKKEFYAEQGFQSKVVFVA
jgi:hypothetical protein